MATPPSPGPEDSRVDGGRRRFVSRLTWLLSFLTGAAVMGGPLAMLFDPLLRRPRKTDTSDGGGWTALAPVTRFAVGGPPARVILKADRTDAWLSRPGTPVGPVLVQRLAEDRFRVFSGICPHLGCSVGVTEKPAGYLCPCHRSNFDSGGALLPHEDGATNPAPRGLDTLEWRVAGGQLEVRWIRYQPGTSEQVRIS